jgi:exosortase
MFNVLFVVLFISPITDLVQMSMHSDTFSYIPFMPLIIAYLMYSNRQRLLSHNESDYPTGFIFISIGVMTLLFALIPNSMLDEYSKLTIKTISMILIWIGGFAFCYGIRTLKAAAFPISFLLFMVPVPADILDKFILILQIGSTEAAYGFLRISGIPIERDGFVFHLMTADIEVAKECSGIRSSLSLIITGLLAGYFFLRTWWARSILMATILPITIVKNGFRIAVLSLLGVYVDESILGSDLHRRGGVLFFILALVLVWVIIILLRKIEGKYMTEPQSRLGCKVNNS